MEKKRITVREEWDENSVSVTLVCKNQKITYDPCNGKEVRGVIDKLKNLISYYQGKEKNTAALERLLEYVTSPYDH